MTTTVATSLAHGTTAEVLELTREALAAQLGGRKPALVAVFASTQQDVGALVAGLSGPGTVAIGASTAGEFTERGDAKGSVSVFAVASDDLRVTAGLGTGLRAGAEAAIDRALEGQPHEMRGFPHRTGITLLDPFAGNGEETALLIAEKLGPDQPLVGGAAGDDLAMKRTVVACGEQSDTDAVVIAQIFSRRPLAFGVAHGHRAISEPLRVTRATEGWVHEVDGRPAWEVWREHTRDAARARGIDVDALDPAREGAFLLQFEAGLANGGSYKIRAPLSRREDGSILFAAAIPQGSVLRITESDAPSQIRSALSAASVAKSAVNAPIAGALVFDCICRNLILGADFAKAVHGISETLGDVPIAGFETYGEVALSAGDMSAFHNTTSVVLAFPR
jgi:methyl-accepting chemotaxis protein